jgi:ABC-type multidrug transport system fused ATPase/permease subunit
VTSYSLPLGFLRRHPVLLARFVLASLGRAFITAITILLIRSFLVKVLESHQASSLWYVVGLLFLAYMTSALLTFDARVSEQRIVTAIELGTMDRLVRHILSLSVGFFDRRTHGDLLTAIRQDVTNIRAIALSGASLVIEGVLALGLMAAATSLSPTLAFWAFFVIPLAVLPLATFSRKIMTRSIALRMKGVAIFDVLNQLLQGIRIIKIYEAERSQADATIERADLYFGELMRMERIRAWAKVATESISAVSLVAVIIVGGFQVLSGAIGWPELLAFLIAARAVQGPLNNMNTAYLEIQRHHGSLVHVDELLRQQPEVKDLPDAEPLQQAPASLEARGLGFSINGTPVLRDVSFRVNAGEVLGIVGPSGAGKTTLLNLVARFYDPTEGAILVDGKALQRIRLADLHDKMAIVTQDPFLFTASIRENIRLGKPAASDAKVEAAARDAEIHDDIMAMPQGYDTIVGHGGRALSRGEAQRVNIARAILKDAPILLLDEATSSLDSFAEVRVQRALDHLVAGRLAISIAHRLSTLRNATRILVIEDGSSVGLGTHAELLATSPTYLRLWEAQTMEEGARSEN